VKKVRSSGLDWNARRAGGDHRPHRAPAAVTGLPDRWASVEKTAVPVTSQDLTDGGAPIYITDPRGEAHLQGEVMMVKSKRVKGRATKGKMVTSRDKTGNNRRGRLDVIWCVRDPSGISTLEDIVFQADPNRLAQIVTGTGLDRWIFENHTFYLDEASARADAVHRLQARR
jgi:hypothetical protein